MGETHGEVKFVLRGWGGGVRDDVGKVANKTRGEPCII